jgi:hypothetical protein
MILTASAWIAGASSAVFQPGGSSCAIEPTREAPDPSKMESRVVHSLWMK